MTAAPQTPVFRVIRELGKRVHATHAALRGEHELVVLQKIERSSASPEAIEQLIRSANCLAKAWHTNVARVRDVEVNETTITIATEYIDGVTLAELATSELPAPMYIRVVVDVLGGLQHLHSMRDDAGQPAGMIHGAVCPENIVIGKDGVARLIAPFRPRPVKVTKASEWLGYASPEALEEGAKGPRSDLYACGVLLWEGLQAKRLFPENDPTAIRQRQRQEEIRWSAGAASIVARLGAVVLRSVAFDPALRFKAATELAAAIRRAAGTEITTGSRVAAKVVEFGGDRIRARRHDLGGSHDSIKPGKHDALPPMSMPRPPGVSITTPSSQFTPVGAVDKATPPSFPAATPVAKTTTTTGARPVFATPADKPKEKAPEYPAPPPKATSSFFKDVPTEARKAAPAPVFAGTPTPPKAIKPQPQPPPPVQKAPPPPPKDSSPSIAIKKDPFMRQALGWLEDPKPSSQRLPVTSPLVIRTPPREMPPVKPITTIATIREEDPTLNSAPSQPQPQANKPAKPPVPASKTATGAHPKPPPPPAPPPSLPELPKDAPLLVRSAMVQQDRLAPLAIGSLQSSYDPPKSSKPQQQPPPALKKPPPIPESDPLLLVTRSPSSPGENVGGDPTLRTELASVSRIGMNSEVITARNPELPKVAPSEPKLAPPPPPPTPTPEPTRPRAAPAPIPVPAPAPPSNRGKLIAAAAILLLLLGAGFLATRKEPPPKTATAPTSKPTPKPTAVTATPSGSAAPAEQPNVEELDASSPTYWGAVDAADAGGPFDAGVETIFNPPVAAPAPTTTAPPKPTTYDPLGI